MATAAEEEKRRRRGVGMFDVAGSAVSAKPSTLEPYRQFSEEQLRGKTGAARLGTQVKQAVAAPLVYAYEGMKKPTAAVKAGIGGVKTFGKELFSADEEPGQPLGIPMDRAAQPATDTGPAEQPPIEQVTTGAAPGVAMDRIPSDARVAAVGAPGGAIQVTDPGQQEIPAGAIGVGEAGGARFTGVKEDYGRFKSGIEAAQRGRGASRLVPKGDPIGTSYSPDYGFGVKPQAGMEEVAAPRTIGGIGQYKRDVAERDKRMAAEERGLERATKRESARYGAMGDVAKAEAEKRKAEIMAEGKEREFQAGRGDVAFERGREAEETQYQRAQDRLKREDRLKELEREGSLTEEQALQATMDLKTMWGEEEVEITDPQTGKKRPMTFNERLRAEYPSVYAKAYGGGTTAPVRAIEKLRGLPPEVKKEAEAEFKQRWGSLPQGV